MPERRSSLSRILGEALLIVVSVYAAIILEGISSDRQKRVEALDALVSLRAEMERDLSDVAEIIDLQNRKTDQYERLNGWLRRPPVEIPSDSFSVALQSVLRDNRTLFPRSAAWKTMTSSGQLAALADQEIVGRLANVYENLNARLEYNGASYDARIQDAHYGVLGPVWDPVEGSFQVGDGSAGAVGYMIQHLYSWNQFYAVLLVEWQREAQALREEVDQYLAASGRGT